MVKGPEEWTISDDPFAFEWIGRHTRGLPDWKRVYPGMGYPFTDDPGDTPELTPAEKDAIKARQKREREQEQEIEEKYKELSEKAAISRMVALQSRPRCRADLSITPMDEEGIPLPQNTNGGITVMVMGSMVVAGEVIRAAGRIFAEEMYLQDDNVPDYINDGEDL